MVLGMDLNGPVGWPTDYSPGEIAAGLIIFVVMVGLRCTGLGRTQAMNKRILVFRSAHSDWCLFK